MSEVFVLSAKRSPIGRFGGSYSSLGPAQLATPILRGVLDQAGNPDELLDLLIMGNVLSGGHGQLIARQAAKHAQIPDSVDAVMVDMVCSSGMMSVIMGASLIQSRMTHLVLAAGVESMSTAGFGLSSKARWGYKYLPVANEPLVLTSAVSDEVKFQKLIFIGILGSCFWFLCVWCSALFRTGIFRILGINRKIHVCTTITPQNDQKRWSQDCRELS